MSVGPAGPLLVVSGRDSSGGAGIDADREAAEAAGLRGLFVATACTVQDATGLRELGARDPDEWLGEARRLAAQGPSALKLGLLPGAPHFAAAARLAAELRAAHGAGFPVVMDPVLAASSGGAFLDAGGLAALLAALPSLGAVLTPNLPEAAELSGFAFEALARDAEQRVAAARELARRGARAVVLKGGHGAEDPVRDLVWESSAGARWIEHPRVCGGGIRGSGCRHATAVAAALAGGASLDEAAARAAAYVFARIAAAARAPAR